MNECRTVRTPSSAHRRLASPSRSGIALLTLACLAFFPHGTDGARAAKPVVLQKQVDALVGQLFSGPLARSGAIRGTIRFDGVAWDTGEGVAAGTSRLGLDLDDALKGALAERRMDVATGSLAGSKGIGSTLLRGGFKVLKSGVQLSLALVDANTGRVISKAQRVMSANSLAGVAQEELLPPDATNARLLARLVTGSLGGATAAGGLRLSTDRGTQAAYAEGDTLHVLVESDRDCYVRLYHISWSDRALTLVFPNRSDRDSYLPAGTLKSIPAEGTGVVFEVSKPYGVDALVAISSATPFDDDAAVTAGLAGAAALPLSGAAKGVSRVGDYLARQGVSAAQARGVLAKGLFVRLPESGSSAEAVAEPAYVPEPAAPPAGAETITPEAAPQPADPEAPAVQTSPQEAPRDPPPTSLSPPPPVAPGNSPLARAVCYFTTLPRLRLLR